MLRSKLLCPNRCFFSWLVQEICPPPKKRKAHKIRSRFVENSLYGDVCQAVSRSLLLGAPIWFLQFSSEPTSAHNPPHLETPLRTCAVRPTINPTACSMVTVLFMLGFCFGPFLVCDWSRIGLTDQSETDQSETNRRPTVCPTVEEHTDDSNLKGFLYYPI